MVIHAASRSGPGTATRVEQHAEMESGKQWQSEEGAELSSKNQGEDKSPDAESEEQKEGDQSKKATSDQGAPAPGPLSKLPQEPLLMYVPQHRENLRPLLLVAPHMQ